MGGGLALLIRDLRAILENKALLHQCLLMLTLYISNIIEETEDQSVLENSTATLLPEFANYFLVYELKGKIAKLGIGNLWIGHLDNTLLFFNAIFQWLRFMNYFRGKITLNELYRPTEPPKEEEAD